MALHLTKADALFVHVPKCGGHYVEDVLKSLGIEYTHPKPIKPACPRHGRKTDFAGAKYTFCTMRPLDQFMLSYWRFHMLMGHNNKIWDEGIDFPHRILGPPMEPWQEWEPGYRETARDYLESMTAGCDRIIELSNINEELADTLRQLGYDVTAEQIAAVPRANVTTLKIELGGGSFRYGHGFANIDIETPCDFQWNLNQTPYPFPDESVDAVYSSHCLEHLECPHRTLHEIARICKVGASVRINVPHPGSHMAMCAGHRHVLSPMMIENMDVHFPELHWKGARRLKLLKLTYGPTPWFHQAKQELPFLAGLDDQIIMKWIPNACHESQFQFVVQENR